MLEGTKVMIVGSTEKEVRARTLMWGTKDVDCVAVLPADGRSSHRSGDIERIWKLMEPRSLLL